MPFITKIVTLTVLPTDYYETAGKIGIRQDLFIGAWEAKEDYTSSKIAESDTVVSGTRIIFGHNGSEPVSRLVAESYEDVIAAFSES